MQVDDRASPAPIERYFGTSGGPVDDAERQSPDRTSRTDNSCSGSLVHAPRAITHDTRDLCPTIDSCPVQHGQQVLFATHTFSRRRPAAANSTPSTPGPRRRAVLRTPRSVLCASCAVRRAPCFLLRAWCFVLRASCFALRAPCFAPTPGSHSRYIAPTPCRLPDRISGTRPPAARPAARHLRRPHAIPRRSEEPHASPPTLSRRHPAKATTAAPIAAARPAPRRRHGRARIAPQHRTLPGPDRHPSRRSRQAISATNLGHGS